MQSGIVVQEKTFQQVFVETIPVAGKLVETVLVTAQAEVHRRVAQGRMQIDEQAFFLPPLDELQSQMHGQGRHTGASLCTNQRDDFSGDSRARLLPLLRFHSCQPVQHTLVLHRLHQVFDAACPHRSDDGVRVGR